LAEERTISINRTPVLTLWVVVAERLGFDRDIPLTLGRAVAGLNAYAIGPWDNRHRAMKQIHL
jgi:hypothetical protein